MNTEDMMVTPLIGAGLQAAVGNSTLQPSCCQWGWGVPPSASRATEVSDGLRTQTQYRGRCAPLTGGWGGRGVKACSAVRKVCAAALSWAARIEMGRNWTAVGWGRRSGQPVPDRRSAGVSQCGQQCGSGWRRREAGQVERRRGRRRDEATVGFLTIRTHTLGWRLRGCLVACIRHI
jgi:hypothetical protein